MCVTAKRKDRRVKCFSRHSLSHSVGMCGRRVLCFLLMFQITPVRLVISPSSRPIKTTDTSPCMLNSEADVVRFSVQFHMSYEKVRGEPGEAIPVLFSFSRCDRNIDNILWSAHRLNGRVFIANCITSFTTVNQRILERSKFSRACTSVLHDSRRAQNSNVWSSNVLLWKRHHFVLGLL